MTRSAIAQMRDSALFDLTETAATPQIRRMAIREIARREALRNHRKNLRVGRC